jgi:hypothetical protein
METMMIRWTRVILNASAGAALMIGALSLPAAEPVGDAKKLETLAASAKTPKQHAQVAKQYRLRAESLETKATEHAEKARKAGNTPLPGLAHKWPSMVRTPQQRETELSMQYRRAAEEAKRLAQWHTQLAVEAELAE